MSFGLSAKDRLAAFQKKADGPSKAPPPKVGAGPKKFGKLFGDKVGDKKAEVKKEPAKKEPAKKEPEKKEPPKKEPEKKEPPKKEPEKKEPPKKEPEKKEPPKKQEPVKKEPEKKEPPKKVPEKKEPPKPEPKKEPAGAAKKEPPKPGAKPEVKPAPGKPGVKGKLEVKTMEVDLSLEGELQANIAMAAGVMSPTGTDTEDAAAKKAPAAKKDAAPAAKKDAAPAAKKDAAPAAKKDAAPPAKKDAPAAAKKDAAPAAKPGAAAAPKPGAPQKDAAAKPGAAAPKAGTPQKDAPAAKVATPPKAGTPQKDAAPKAGTPQKDAAPKAGTPQKDAAPKAGTPKAGTPQKEPAPKAGTPQKVAAPKAGTPQKDAPGAKVATPPKAGTPQKDAAPKAGTPQKDVAPKAGTPQKDAAPKAGTPQKDAAQKVATPPKAGTPQKEPTPKAGTPQKEPTPKAGTPQKDAAPKAGTPQKQPPPKAGTPQKTVAAPAKAATPQKEPTPKAATPVKQEPPATKPAAPPAKPEDDKFIKCGPAAFVPANEDFYNTLFYFSGMGTVIGESVGAGVYVSQNTSKRGLDIEFLESEDNKRRRGHLKQQQIVQNCRNQATDLTEELKRLQALLESLPTFGAEQGPPGKASANGEPLKPYYDAERFAQDDLHRTEEQKHIKDTKVMSHIASKEYAAMQASVGADAAAVAAGKPVNEALVQPAFAPRAAQPPPPFMMQPKPQHPAASHGFPQPHRQQAALHPAAAKPMHPSVQNILVASHSPRASPVDARLHSPIPLACASPMPMGRASPIPLRDSHLAHASPVPYFPSPTSALPPVSAAENRPSTPVITRPKAVPAHPGMGVFDPDAVKSKEGLTNPAAGGGAPTVGGRPYGVHTGQPGMISANKPWHERYGTKVRDVTAPKPFGGSGEIKPWQQSKLRAGEVHAAYNKPKEEPPQENRFQPIEPQGFRPVPQRKPYMPPPPQPQPQSHQHDEEIVSLTPFLTSLKTKKTDVLEKHGELEDHMPHLFRPLKYPFPSPAPAPPREAAMPFSDL